MRPMLAEHPSRFLLLERAVEDEYRPRMLQELQGRVNDLAEKTRATSPVCALCGRLMVCQDVRPISWWARFGRLRVGVPRYRCPACGLECRPLLDLLGVEPGRMWKPLWGLDQPPGKLNLHAMLRDTLAALQQLPAACSRLRKNLPPQTHLALSQLELTLRPKLNPAEAYNMVSGRDPQNG